MATTTFSGPVISKNGFVNTGPGMTVSLTADTTLTVASHAGRILLCNDADGKFTLPSVVPVVFEIVPAFTGPEKVVFAMIVLLVNST